MAQGITKTISKNVSAYVGSPYGTETIYFKMDITETYDVTTRKSSLLFDNFQMKTTNTPTGTNAYIRGKINLKYGSTTVAILENDSSSNVQVNVQSTYQAIKKSGVNYTKTISNIPHNADGTLSVTVKFDNFYIDSPGTSLHDATFTASEDETVVLTTLPSEYTLSISVGTHASGTVTLNSSSYRTAGGTLSNGAKIYSGETVQVTFSASSGYEALGTVNGTSVSSGTVKTVSGNITVAITARALGNVFINGEAYQAYIFDGTAWALFVPNIFTGSAWNIY